jgi:heme/copper-type cytochrome/quinol oxidase subunit 2
MLNMRQLLLKISVLALGIFSLAGLSLFIAPKALAINCSTTAPTTTQEAIQCGTDNSAGVPNGGAPARDLNNTIANIINILSAAVGVIAVIMIIVGGFRYVASSGSQDAIGKAKNTILYAVIGLVIVAFAQIIVHFVLHQATSTSSASGSGSSSSTCPNGQPVC